MVVGTLKPSIKCSCPLTLKEVVGTIVGFRVPTSCWRKGQRGSEALPPGSEPPGETFTTRYFFLLQAGIINVNGGLVGGGNQNLQPGKSKYMSVLYHMKHLFECTPFWSHFALVDCLVTEMIALAGIAKEWVSTYFLASLKAQLGRIHRCSLSVMIMLLPCS